MWQVVICSFLSGVFIANGVPHFVKGVTGEKFFTPFNRKEFSSARTNAMFGVANFIIGGIFLYFGHIDTHVLAAGVAFAVAVAFIATSNSIIFTRRLAEKAKK